MSDLFGVIVAAASAVAAPAVVEHHDPEPAPLRNAVTIAVPSLDGLRGAAISYERWLPGRRLGIAVTGQLRQTATGDYGAVRTGAGLEARWYWRASAWRSSQPAGSMVGWFVGGRLDFAIVATHDRVDDRWLGTALDLGSTGFVGYRITPWRGLELTPTVGVGLRREVDLSGRLPSWSRGTFAGGLSAGWLF